MLLLIPFLGCEFNQVLPPDVSEPVRNPFTTDFQPTADPIETTQALSLRLVDGFIEIEQANFILLDDVNLADADIIIIDRRPLPAEELIKFAGLLLDSNIQSEHPEIFGVLKSVGFIYVIVTSNEEGSEAIAETVDEKKE